ncbi:type II toxin-antitoxin system HicB family antitoxin [Brasilonema octagenarum]|nr:type II toxin-antitoxin system HicB family antitoxin [Brasilonema octagenarum]
MVKGNLVSPSMNFQAIASLNKMSLHVLVERVESGYFMASVPELPDCVALAQTREEAICAERSSEAIAALQEKLRVRLLNIEVLTLEVTNNPWTEFIGMFEGDNEFAELAAQLRAERELDINGTA